MSDSIFTQAKTMANSKLQSSAHDTSDSCSEETELIYPNETSDTTEYTITLNLELLRGFALTFMLLLFATGKVFKRCVFTDVDEWYTTTSSDLSTNGNNLRGLLQGATESITDGIAKGGRNLGFNVFGHPFCEPYVEMRQTFIWKTFGFPHICSFIDFNPFKEIFAICMPIITLPMTAFLILAHIRVKLACQNKEADEWLLTYSRITTPFNIMVMGWTYLWFVNDPEMTYPQGYGFIGHYIPYALFQWTLALMSVSQLHYHIAQYKKGGHEMPFGTPIWLAKLFVRTIFVFSLSYQIVVISILMGKPILDSASGGVEGTWQRLVFKMLTKLYTLFAVVIPIIISFRDSRVWAKSKMTITFTSPMGGWC